MHTPFFFPCLDHLSPSIPILSSRTHMDWEHTLATLYTCTHACTKGRGRQGNAGIGHGIRLPAFLLQKQRMPLSWI